MMQRIIDAVGRWVKYRVLRNTKHYEWRGYDVRDKQ